MSRRGRRDKQEVFAREALVCIGEDEDEYCTAVSIIHGNDRIIFSCLTATSLPTRFPTSISIIIIIHSLMSDLDWFQ